MRVNRILVLFMGILVVAVSLHATAKAQTFVEYLPSYGMYCEDPSLIKSGTVKFDLKDMELLKQGVCIKQSEYQVANGELDLTIPFISSALDLPNIDVMLNGQAVEKSLWYGDVILNGNKFDVEKIYSPVLNESIIGTLYTLIPDADTISISLSFAEKNSFIYETSNELTSYFYEDGYTWNFKNALSKSSYHYFVVGDAKNHSFLSSCKCEVETMSCKEFIDNQYTMLSEYYDYYGGISVELFYSLVNKILQIKSNISYDDLFLSSIAMGRLNAYRIHEVTDSDAIINYEMQIKVQKNCDFKPVLYLVEHNQAVSCPTTFKVELNNYIPYIIESSIPMERNRLKYTAESTDDFYFVFCSSENPERNTVSNSDSTNRYTTIFCIIGCLLLVISVLLFIVLKIKKQHK